MKKLYKLADSTIAEIARSLQMALLTGTDVSDHFRMLELEENKEGLLEPSVEYMKMIETNQNSLLSKAEELKLEVEKSSN